MQSRLMEYTALACVGVLLGTQIAHVRADGIPSGPTMYYGVTLDEGGSAVTGTRDLRVRFYNEETAGTQLCETFTNSTPFNQGRARIPLSETCRTAVQQNASVWVELAVGGAVIGSRTRLGAVPYAVEAQRADGLTAAALARVAPVSTYYAEGSATRASGEATWVPITGLRVAFTTAMAGTAEIFSLLNVYGDPGPTRCAVRFKLDGMLVAGGGGDGTVGVNQVNVSPNDVAQMVGLRRFSITEGAHVVTVEGAKSPGLFGGTTCVFAAESSRLRVQVQ